jgi:hypothetical protein
VSRNEYVIQASEGHRRGKKFFDELNSGVLPDEIVKSAGPVAATPSNTGVVGVPTSNLGSSMREQLGALTHHTHSPQRPQESAMTSTEARRRAETDAFETLMRRTQEALRTPNSEAIRHISGDMVRQANVAAHSTVINNNQRYHYDHRTEFSGPVTVKSDDPMKMAAELKRQSAHARLVAPGRATYSGGGY